MITQKELKEIFSYNPDTGLLIRNKTTSPAHKKGDVAGGVTSFGYVRVQIKNKKYMAHRLAWLYMTGEWPRDEIDHIDHIKTNNKWDNLRNVTHRENMLNQSIGKNNKSGVTGVSWNKYERLWIAQICINRKDKILARTNDLFECCCVRKSHENKFGFHKNHGQ